MATTTEAASPDESGAWPAAPLTRVLELLAESCGVKLEPRCAWEAAAEGVAAGHGDVQRSLGLATRRAGLKLGRVMLSWPGEPNQLFELGSPTLTWLPGPRGGRWLVVLGRYRRLIEIALVDEAGERRRRLTSKQLGAWLEREFAGAPAGPQWLRAEPLLPLAAIGSQESKPLGPIRRLVGFARLERQDIGIIFVYAVAIGGMSLAVPVAVQALVNTVAFGSVLQPLVIISVLLAIVLGFMAVLRVLEVVVVEALQRRIFVRTASDFARRFPRLSANARQQYHPPELANRVFDVATLQKTGASLLIEGLTLVLQMAVGMALLAFYHPLLLVFDLALLIGIALVVFVAGRGAIETSLRESDAKYAMSAWIEDLAASPLRFADADARAFADARAEVLVREWLQSRGDHFKRVVRQLTGGIALQVLASTVLLGLGGYLVVQRQLTLGQLVAAELVVTSIGYGLGSLGKHLDTFYDAVTAAAKIGKIVDLPLELGGGELLLDPGPMAVSVRKRGAADGAGKLFDLQPGESLGLIGQTPLHSDLCDLLFGFGGPTDLDVRFDGCSLRALDLEALRSDMALVRGIELITSSLLDNLDPRAIQSDGKSLRAILELVDLRERVANLPDEMRTRLLPNGWPLRQSEAQRLMLAQALVRRPRLLLIDGGLDGLGLETEARERLLDHLFATSAPWTLIVITEESDVLRRCSQRQKLG